MNRTSTMYKRPTGALCGHTNGIMLEEGGPHLIPIASTFMLDFSASRTVSEAFLLFVYFVIAA